MSPQDEVQFLREMAVRFHDLARKLNLPPGNDLLDIAREFEERATGLEKESAKDLDKRRRV
jgi:hypothetical protein